MKCMTCKTPLANTPGGVRFACPKCGKQEIIRCKHCRQTAAKYQCPECEFEGPN